MNQSLTQLKKTALRKQIKERLKSIPQISITTQSKLATSTILTNLPEFQNAKTIGLYMNLPTGELQTQYLIENSVNLNKTIYLPRITNINKFNVDEYKRHPKQNSILRFLKVDSLTEINNLQPKGRYQIREPEFKPNNANDLLSNHLTLDLLIVPGVAFDKNCDRMGHGVGFYDDFIKRYSETHNGEKPFLVGIGLSEQLLTGEQEEVLHKEDHDEQLDAVVIGDRIFRKKN